MNPIRLCLLLFVLFFIPLAGYGARIYGTITDEKNQPMPFVTVYMEGQFQNFATGSNQEGNYAFELSPGIYKVAFRFIGYKTLVREVEIQNKDILINIQMEPETVNLQEVEVTNQKKDPAYEIIRQAQAKRKYYLEQVNAFSANAYIKGLQRITEAPKKILGKDVILPGVSKDSANAAIVYLSESISRFYYQQPDQRREEMISSKVSGRSNAFSWNSALDFNLNLYENNILVEDLSPRPFISPISSTAMVHYKYEYMGIFEDQGVKVNKIKVIPRQKGSPLFSGYVYIQEDSWRIHTAELLLTKDAGIDFVDTLSIRIVNAPVTKDVWMISTQTIEFNWKFDLLKIKGKGYFIGVFSNYNLNPQLGKNFFSAEVIKIEKEANQKDSLYWEQMRPVALTLEEKQDYYRKDSIYKVYDSKAFKDSIDRRSNKFKPISLLLGYTYRNSYRQYGFEFSSLLNNIQLNTVEGYNINAGLGFYKDNREKNSNFNLNTDFRYGLSSEKLYLRSTLYKRFNARNRLYVRLQGGHFISQFNEANPISFFVNSLYTGLLEENYLKLYEKTYFKATTGGEITNGIRLNVGLEYARRRPLVNDTLPSKGHYINYEDKSFTSNDPLNPNNPAPSFNAHNALIFSASVDIHFAQKYMNRPNAKIILPSKYPVVNISYRKGIRGINSFTNFDFLKINVSDDISFGQVGMSSYTVSAGTFLNRAQVPLMDYTHFNTTQTIFSNNQLASFFMLPYYAYSTAGSYLEGHYEHHFHGFMLNRIPPVRKLKWQAVAGSHVLYTKNSGVYMEVTAGLENLFRFGRIDYVTTWQHGHFKGNAVRLRLVL